MGYGGYARDIFTFLFLALGFLFLVLFIITLAITKSAATAGKTCCVVFGFICAALVLFILGNSINANPHNVVAILLWLFWSFVIFYFLFKSKWKLWVRGVIVSAVIAHIVFLIILPMREAKRLAEAEKAERRAFGEKAFAHFEKRCESSGFFIYKNVPKQDSVLIMNSSLKKPTREELNDQYWAGDPYSKRSLNNDVYSANFDIYLFPRHECKYDKVLDETGKPVHDKNGYPTWINARKLDFPAYFKFIEIPDQNNPQQMMRYVGVPTGKTQAYGICTQDLQSPTYLYQGEAITQIQSEYGYQSQDISTKEDRDLWVAGSRLQVIHLKTGEVVAERVGYLFENTFGGTQYLPAWENTRQYCPGGTDALFIIHALSEKLERVEKNYKLINKSGE